MKIRLHVWSLVADGVVSTPLTPFTAKSLATQSTSIDTMHIHSTLKVSCIIVRSVLHLLLHEKLAPIIASSTTRQSLPEADPFSPEFSHRRNSLNLAPPKRNLPSALPSPFRSPDPRVQATMSWHYSAKYRPRFDPEEHPFAPKTSTIAIFRHLYAESCLFVPGSDYQST